MKLIIGWLLIVHNILASILYFIVVIRTIFLFRRIKSINLGYVFILGVDRLLIIVITIVILELLLLLFNL